jgi:hypothetical protein
MYVTDKYFSIMIYCNKRLSDLLNCDKSNLEGRSLSRALYSFTERVPLSRREQFRKDQILLANKYTSDLSPNAERNNTGLTGNTYEGIYRVRMHSDKVRTAAGETIGFFVIYHPDKVLEIP